MEKRSPRKGQQVAQLARGEVMGWTRGLSMRSDEVGMLDLYKGRAMQQRSGRTNFLLQ